MKYRSTWKEHPTTMNKKKTGIIIWVIVGLVAGSAAAFLARIFHGSCRPVLGVGMPDRRVG